MEYRLYFFVPYNISDIQKGIQAGHAALEYAREYGHTQEYVQFIENDKTWVILNGGTTNSSTYYFGTLNEIENELTYNHVHFSVFHEPDLNNALSAICFLADERVWNKELYPDFQEWLIKSDKVMEALFKADSLMNEWKEFVGGDKNVFLRELLKDKHLA